MRIDRPKMMHQGDFPVTDASKPLNPEQALLKQPEHIFIERIRPQAEIFLKSTKTLHGNLPAWELCQKIEAKKSFIRSARFGDLMESELVMASHYVKGYPDTLQGGDMKKERAAFLKAVAELL